MKPFVRSAYNYDMNEASEQTGLTCNDPSLTQQAFKDEADINVIVERFHLTGEIPQLQHMPALADYEGIFDFQTAMNTVRAAEEQFMTLPANLRYRFHNDPQEFLMFCGDPENKTEAKKLGLLRDNIDAPPTTTEALNVDPAKSANPSGTQSGSQTQTPSGGPQGTTNPAPTGQRPGP